MSMIRRRKSSPPAPPPTPVFWWQPRLDAAWQLMARHGSERQRSESRRVLDRVSDALTEVSNDRASLAESIAQLDPDRVAAELKTALRARPDPTAPDDSRITSLRQRHELNHRLLDRLEALDAQIEQTLIDVDTLAARTVELSFAASGSDDFSGELARLNDDLVALTAAHAEIASL